MGGGKEGQGTEEGWRGVSLPFSDRTFLGRLMTALSCGGH